MSDFAILDVAIHLAASKNTEYRKRVLNYFKTLAIFLQTNDLTKRELLDSSEVPSDDFRVMKSDLTDEGLEFIRENLDKWTAKIEKGNSIEDVSILERALQKMRH